MEDVKINQSNPSFRVSGSDARRSLRIESVRVHQWPEPVEEFKLLVLDEKDVPVYRQILSPTSTEGTDTLVVGKEFGFYDHLSVLVTTEPSGSSFSVVVTFE